jgi:diguanylate cyclase (GGDEF)-like protein/PAS domain S-box-containing protein
LECAPTIDTARAKPEGGPVSQRPLLAGFLATVAALTAVFFLLPEQRLLIWTVLGVISAGAVAIGTVRHRPRRRAGWWLIMAALLALTVAEATHLVEDRVVDHAAFPAVADAIYLAVFAPLLIAGVWSLARSGARRSDRAGMLDTLIVAVAAAVVAWAFLISPLVVGNTYTLTEKAVAIGYPVSGVLVLAAVVRLAASVRPSPAVILPLVGVVGMIGSGAAYGLTSLQPGWRVNGLVVLGWALLFAGWGAAALHPSMVELTRRATRVTELNRHRLVALALAALVAPLALLIEATGGMTPDVTVRRAMIVVLFFLVLVRLYTAVDGQLRGSARERGVSGAGAALVEATTTDDVVAAIRSAVARLLPAGSPHEVVVEIGGTVLAGDGAPARAVATAAPGQPGQPRAIHMTDPDLADRPGIPEAVLRCQLVLPHTTGGNDHLGALYVATDESLLRELEPSMEAVASQAAMALERIRLTEEINRRASEEYFRTLVQNTADVILIVLDDYHIRYASPSAATVLGVEQPDRLPDLIPPEDWPEIDHLLQELRQDPHAPIVADWTVLRVDGRRLQAEAVCRDLRADPTVGGIVITLRDVTAQRLLEQQLTHLAFHDPLTGLANRALLRERMERALARAGRDHSVVGMLVLDVDDLKVVNDTLGHAAGDELLIATGKRLSAALRRQDTAARLGGDEFAALIVGAGSPGEVEQIAQRVVASFVEPFAIRGQLISRAVSVGVASSVGATEGEELLRQADLALYVAKSAGKAQWRRYGETPPPSMLPGSPAPSVGPLDSTGERSPPQDDPTPGDGGPTSGNGGPTSGDGALTKVDLAARSLAMLVPSGDVDGTSPQRRLPAPGGTEPHYRHP